MKKSVDGLSFVTDNLFQGWKDAERFAGPGGRVATLPDVIDARLATDPAKRAMAWDNYITTASAEYAGVSKGGVQVLIIAHGIGPLSTVGGLQKAYKKGGRDLPHDKQGVRISREEFLKLESGHYGSVAIVPLEDTTCLYEYPFMEPVNFTMACKDPLVRARLGPRWEEYLAKHDEFARSRWTKEDNTITHPDNPHMLLQVDQPDSWYALGGRNRGDRHEPKRLEFYPDIGGVDPTQAFAHLLVAGQLTGTSFCGIRATQIVSEIGCHGASDHCRLLGLRKDPDFTRLAEASSAEDILRKYCLDLLVPAKNHVKAPIRQIDTLGKHWFTRTLKKGHEMDSGVSEFPVNSVKLLGRNSFTTKIEGYYGFLRYDVNEVLAIAPKEANAYALGETGFGDDNRETHVVEVEFYKADIDYSQRLMTTDELKADADLFVKYLMKFAPVLT